MADRYKTGNLLLRRPNVSGKDVPNHPLMGSYTALPHYLSLTNVPYLSSQFALNSTHELFFSTYRPTAQGRKRPENDANKTFQHYSSLPYNYYSYRNCMSDLEQIMETSEQYEHLKTMRFYDYLNRMSILNSRPIYGRDLRKAVKVQLLLSNLYQKAVKYGKGDVPSAILNCAATQRVPSECTCQDLDNNTVPEGCFVVLECANKKASERKKIKKPQSFLFDPQSYVESNKFFPEMADEEKKLVITIDRDFLAQSAPPAEEQKAAIPLQTEPVANKLPEEHKAVTPEEPRRPIVQPPPPTQPQPQPHQQPFQENAAPEDESMDLGDDHSEVGGYLTRSKMKSMEVRQVPPPVLYNGVTVELIPTRFLESMDHQPEGQQQQMEDSEDPNKDGSIREEEERKEDVGKFLSYRYTDAIKDMIKQPNQRQKELHTMLRQFKVIQPKTLCVGVKLWPASYSTIYKNEESFFTVAYRRLMSAHFVQRALRIANFLSFPDRKLIQYDSGKLQKMSLLLKRLKAQNSKVLIFTQMSKMLDIIESFLNLHGYTYVRLDGSIKVEIRQAIVDRFNNDPRIFCFISSTRCGGIGINLTAADAVIFYDSDWNPAMDKQAQDRCHRIGQTKTVHIYRLITLNTVEENIFKKSLQKREIGGLIMEDGQFDTEFFQKINFKDVLEEEHLVKRKDNIFQKEHITVDESAAKESGPVQEQGKEFMKKLEDALLVIEDKEDVEAAQKAKKEIVDEFEFSEHEDGPQPANGTAAQPSAVAPEQKQVQTHVQVQAPVQPTPPPKKEEELKKNELVDWENNEALLRVTKKSLEFYQRLHPFDEFYTIRSVKDKRSVAEEEDAEMAEEKDKEKPAAGEEEEKAEESDGSSYSIISDTECDDLPESVKIDARRAYEETRKVVLAEAQAPATPTNTLYP